MKSVQIRSFLWPVFSCIWTRKNSVFGHFLRSGFNQDSRSPGNKFPRHFWKVNVINTLYFYANFFYFAYDCFVFVWLCRLFLKAFRLFFLVLHSKPLERTAYVPEKFSNSTDVHLVDNIIIIWIKPAVNLFKSLQFAIKRHNFLGILPKIQNRTPSVKLLYAKNPGY